MPTAPVFIFAFANDRRVDGQYLRNLPAEQKAIRQELERLDESKTYRIVDRSNVTHDDVSRILLGSRWGDRIRLFHFGGHAGNGALMFESQDGEPSASRGEGLAALLGKRGVKLAFLNGCATHDQALALLSAGVASVIVTAEAIDDRVAAKFAGHFYRGIAAGRTIQRAFDDASAAVESECSSKRSAYHRSFVPPSDANLPWPWRLHPGRGGDQTLVDLIGRVEANVSTAANARHEDAASDQRAPGRHVDPLTLEALSPVRDSWQALVDSWPRVPNNRTARIAVRQILGHLGPRSGIAEMVDLVETLIVEMLDEAAEAWAPESVARFYLAVGGWLSRDGQYEAGFRAYLICRQIIEAVRASDAPNDRLLAVYDELTNREAVAMRDDLQPRMALAHLRDYRLPQDRPLLYEGICALGTRAQLLICLAEGQPVGGEAVADDALTEAEGLLRHAISFLEKSSAHRWDLPREHNYMGWALGARGAFEQMSSAFARSLEVNDQQYHEQGPERQDAWIENALYTFQLWLRACDLAADDEQFRCVDRLYRARGLQIVASTGDPDILLQLEDRYPSVLIRRYRARTWARRLSPILAADLWQTRVIEPLVSLEQCFRQVRSTNDLAAAVLVDLLLLADTDESRIGDWCARLIDLLRDVARSSGGRWRGHTYDVEHLYREPFGAELLRLEALKAGRSDLSNIKPILHGLRAQIGY